jgi:hypothetical protein
VRSAYVERVGATSETQRGHGINGWHKAEWAAVRGCRRRIPGPTSRAPAASEPRGGDGRCSLASAPPSESGWVAAAATTPGALPGAGPTVPPAAPAGFVRCRLGVGCEAAQKGRVESTAEPKATSHERPQHSVRETRQRIPGPTSRAPAASAEARGVDGTCSLASAPPSESGWVAAAATTPGALPGAGPTVPPAAPARSVRCRLRAGCEAAQKGRVESTAEPKATSHERPQHSVRETRQRIPGPTSRAPAASAGPRGVDGSCSLASAPPSESGWVAAAATTPGALPGAGPTVPPAAPARAAWKQRGGGIRNQVLAKRAWK